MHVHHVYVLAGMSAQRACVHGSVILACGSAVMAAKAAAAQALHSLLRDCRCFASSFTTSVSSMAAGIILYAFLTCRQHRLNKARCKASDTVVHRKMALCSKSLTASSNCAVVLSLSQVRRSLTMVAAVSFGY